MSGSPPELPAAEPPTAVGTQRGRSPWGSGGRLRTNGTRVSWVDAGDQPKPRRKQAAAADGQSAPRRLNRKEYRMQHWLKTLDLGDIFRAELPWNEKRDEMVRRVRALDPNDEDGELQDIADDLGAAADGDEWDIPWDAFYDWANYNLVWVDTFGTSKRVTA